MALCCMAFSFSGYAQHSLHILIKDEKTKDPLPGVVAFVPGTATGNSSDNNGFVTITGIPSGKQAVSFRFPGYETRTDSIVFPLSGTDTFFVYMQENEEELEETIVSTTRSSRTIQDIPTRVELVAGEELEEKANMKPGDIRMVLAESTGIQMLQTSATSGNSSIRIQGMDGRYTQILKDGLPLYAGFSGGLGLLQTPPLNLKRVEIVKGASSTLYGGGAIAGLVNLVSKTPGSEPEARFLANGTSAGGLDLNGFYSRKFGKAGITLYGAYDMNKPYAPRNVDFTAIPEFSRFTFSPKLFLYLTPETEISLGLNSSFEKRTGGDIKYLTGIGDSTNRYYETNNTERFSTEFELLHRLSKNANLKIKNSISQFYRTINVPGYVFDGRQTSSFSEISYATENEKTEWIGGLNFFTDAFTEQQVSPTPLRNYKLLTPGVFLQNTWTMREKLILETGIRYDYVVNYSPVLLPRFSLLYKPSAQLTSRIGGGLGYKAPTIFTEESERILYQNVLPVNTDSNRLEKSYGGNWDVNYKTSIADGAIHLSFNQLIFYTRINNPLLLSASGSVFNRFRNTAAHIDAQGGETNIKVTYRDFKLFLGYTYTDSRMHSGTIDVATPLTPLHRTNTVLMYEVEDKWKIGLEAYYFGPQKLNNGGTGRDYWLCGAMAERLWKRMSVFINFENILDSRQSKFGNYFTGSVSNPVFSDLYAPMEGFIANGGIKLNL